MAQKLIEFLLNHAADFMCVILDYLIYKYVRKEYEESKEGNQLLKKLMLSRKRSRVKAVIKELVKPTSQAA